MGRIELVFASNNAHKVQEANQIAQAFNVGFVRPHEGFNPVEDGKTFEENAVIKACAAAKLNGRELFLADDSGLCVEYLEGEPGIHSARYAPTSEEAIDKLLKRLEGVPRELRAAKFVCAMALVDKDGKVLRKTMGTCHGHIGFQRAGKGGFGYDPVFVLQDGRTMAELSDDEKNIISHRGRALVDMLIWLKIQQNSATT
jgi:XTP/dITP diphosphohydrolase